jgi:hypothetical protein
MAVAITRVPTVAEIQERMKQRADPAYVPQPTENTPAAGSIKPVTIRLDDPPPDVVSNKTLSLSARSERSLCISQILEKHDIDPVEELITMYNERNEDPESPDYGKFVMSRSERVSLMKEILKYQHPTLKAVEHKGNADDKRVTVVLMMPDGSTHRNDVEQRGKVIDA